MYLEKANSNLFLGLKIFFCELSFIILLFFLPIEQGIAFVTFLGIFLLTFLLGIKNTHIKITLIIAFFIRLVLALVQFYLFPLPDSTADAVAFERVAWEMASQGNLIDSFTTGAYMYSWFISVFYSLFGVRSPLFMQSVNVFLGVMVVFNVYKITELIYNDKKVSKIAAFISAIYPTMALYSAITLREAFFAYFVTAGMIFFVKWLRKNKIITFLISNLLFLVSSLFHTAGFFLIFSAFIILLIKLFKTFKKKKFPLKKIVLVFVGILLILVMFTTGIGLDKIIRLLNAENIGEALVTTQLNYLEGRTAFPSFLTPNSVEGIIVLSPIRLLYFVFSPFVWYISSAGDIFGLIDALILIYIFLNIFKIKNYKQYKNDVVTLTFFIIIVLLATSLGVNNIGTAIRHRAKFIPILISLSSYNIYYNSKLFRFIRSIFVKYNRKV
jgi:hypothetical protein